MSEREFTLFQLDVTLGDLGVDDEDEDENEEQEEDESGRSTARLAALAFVAAGAAGAAAVAYLRLGGDDEGDEAETEYEGADAFGADRSVAADLDAETDRRLDRVRGAFPTRAGGFGDRRPDAGAGASTLIGLLFLMAASVAARYLAAADESTSAVAADADAETDTEALAESA